MSEELKLFNQEFPESKYREIRPLYEGDTTTEEGLKHYQESKRPINSKVISFEEIKDTPNRIGWIVPKEYIVVDIDNKKDAGKVFDLLQAFKVKFSYMTGKKGGHFIFRNDRGIKSISAGENTGIGIKVDIRCNEKGYIILPENDKYRKWGTISKDVDDIPFWLIPLPKLKIQDDFSSMGNGDGRNDALLKHMLSLIDYAKELTLEEKCECIRIINAHLFKDPLSDAELTNTVLRDDILKKQSEDSEEKGCYEEKLAARVIKDKQIITCNDDCYIYNGKYYRKVLDNTEIERIIHLDYNSSLKDKQRKEVLKFIKLKSWVPSYELNKNWHEIVFRNGILNLSTMTMTPHTPSVYNTIYIDCNYVKDAPYSPLIDDFFNQISGREEDKKTLLYEIVGYCLIRKNVFEKFFFCFGEGATGKSTYLKMITNLVGRTNAAFLSLNNLEETYMPANLFGKLVNIGDDVAYKGIKESDVLKKLVTGEMFAAQQKYKQEPLNFSNFAKLIFTTNKLPEVYDRTSGFYRRVLIIDINHKIEHPDPFFMERLTEQDYEYLLSVAIDKLLGALTRNGLTHVESSVLTLQEYMTDQSSVLSFLRDKDYTKKRLDHKPCTEIYIEYDSYCRATGFKPLKKVNFDREICEEFKFVKRNTTWVGETSTNQCWRYVSE